MIEKLLTGDKFKVGIWWYTFQDVETVFSYYDSLSDSAKDEYLSNELDRIIWLAKFYSEPVELTRLQKRALRVQAKKSKMET